MRYSAHEVSPPSYLAAARHPGLLGCHDQLLIVDDPRDQKRHRCHARKEDQPECLRPALDPAAHAEARLDFALWREAYRRLGWNHRLVPFNVFEPPATWDETAPSFESYRRVGLGSRACARSPCNAHEVLPRRQAGGGSPRLRGETVGAACVSAHPDRR